MRAIPVCQSTRCMRRKLLLLIGAIAAALTLGCGVAAATTAVGVAGSAADQSVANGTYRVAISDADLKAHGVTSPGDIHENHGLFTWVLRDGHWQAHQKAAGLENPNFTGLYTLKGNRITFAFLPKGNAPPSITMRWKLAAGKLRFTYVRGGDPIVQTFFTAHAWTKIG
jgi:hypothetical protein